MKKIFFICTLTIILVPQISYAYIDPGMGSAFIQFIVAIVSAVALYISYAIGFFKKIFNNFLNYFKKDKKKKDI